MKSKQLSLIFASLLAIVLAMGMASAISVDGGSAEFTREGQTEVVTVSSNDYFNVKSTYPNNTFSSGAATFNITNISNMNNETSVDFNLTLQDLGSGINFGERITETHKVTVENASNPSQTDTAEIEANYEKSFCDMGRINDDDTEITIESVENLDEDRDNDRDVDNWKPLDTIEVEVDFENDKNDNSNANDLEDIILEMGLYEKGTDDNIADDLIWLSDEDEQYDAGDVDAEEGLDDTHTFRFQVDPNDFEESGDYYLTVKSYEDNNEDEFCNDKADHDDIGGNNDIKSDEVEIEFVDDWEEMFVIDTSSVEEPLEASCGSSVNMDLEVWNIGTEDAVDDFEDDYEDRMEVEVFSNSLNIERNLTLRNVFDQGDSESFSVGFEVPRGIDKGEFNRHDVGASLLYGYEDFTDSYNDYEETYSQSITEIIATGQCSIPKASVPTASLDQGSVPQAGGSFTMTTTIENTGEEETSYNVGLSDHTTWISSYQTNQDTFTLEKDESTQVQISVNVRDGVSGNQSFNVQVSSDGELVSERQVTVPVQKAEEQKGGLNFDNFDANSLVPILLALIAAAIIAIAIVLIVRATRKDKKAEVTPGVADF